MNIRLNCWQPSCLSRVKEQEHNIVLFDQFFKLQSVFDHFLLKFRIRTNGVPRHRNRQHNASSVNFGVNLFKTLGCDLSLVIFRFLTIFEREETLSNRVAKRYLSRVNKSNLSSVSPSKQVSCNLAAQTASS